MASKPSTFSVINEKFFAMSMRERWLIIGAGLAMILLFGFTMFVEPAMKDAERANQQTAQEQRRARQLDAQIALLEEEIKKDPNIPLNARLAAIDKQITELDASLDAQTEDLVPADRMPLLLEKVLERTDKIELIALTSIPPQKLITAEENAEHPEDLEDVNLFQHGVKLTVRGSYFDVQSYLEQVEQLPWRFYWKTFDYRVDEYPRATVDIELYTLSTNEAFIGVSAND